MKTFLRSMVCGIAAIVVAFLAWIFVTLIVAIVVLERAPSPPGGGEVGWDLVSMVHNSPVSAKLLALAAFLIGFALGYWHFSRSSRAGQSTSV
ncbi:MAG TPA: hypothetical protein VMH00_04990 [Candidatus Limnocylindrales bacterium]|nr:hypothetical protein [Candidatus Limnocylindrales bacterium]